jgi:hypothetical protein
MAKAVIQFNYNQYVMEAEDALKIGDEASYNVWAEPNREIEVTLIPDDRYRIAKLAGQPVKE